MKQFKALLIKEWDTNRFQFLFPAFFTGGMFLIALIGWIIGRIKGVDMSFMSQSLEGTPGLETVFLYSGVMGLVMLLGFVTTLTVLGLSENVLNTGRKMRCEIMHFSQPVSVAKIVSSKFAFAVLGSILLLGVLSFLTAVIFALVSVRGIGADFYFGLTAWLQSWLQMSIRVLILGSTLWFFAGLFKKNAFLFGIFTLAGIEVVIAILNMTANLNIPSALTFFFNYVLSYQEMFRGFGIGDTLSGRNLAQIGPEMRNAVSSVWQSIFSWNTALRLGISAVLFLTGSYLYQRRELT